MSALGDTCPFALSDGTGFVVDEATRVAQPCRCRPGRIERHRASSPIAAATSTTRPPHASPMRPLAARRVT